MTAEQQETASRTAGRVRTAILHAADWLCLAATPTFAALVLLTSVSDRGAAAALCSAAQASSPLSGMALMYLLMSVFHAAPWLRLVASRWGCKRSPCST